MLHSKRLMKRLPHVVHTKGSLGTNEKRLHMLAAVVQQVGLPSLHPAARECVQQGIVMHNSDLKILSESLGALQPTLLFSWLRDVPRSTATPLESHMPERLIPLVVRAFPTADRCMRGEDPTFVELGARPSQAVESSNRSSWRSCWHSTHDIDRREYQMSRSCILLGTGVRPHEREAHRVYRCNHEQVVQTLAGGMVARYQCPSNRGGSDSVRHMAGTVCIQRQDFRLNSSSGLMKRGEIQLPASILCAFQYQRGSGIVQSEERFHP